MPDPQPKNPLHGITLEHVKLADTAEAVRRVRDEVKAGTPGSADLIWINGENFRVMKQERLLFGPFAEDLPNFALVDVEGKPTTRIDFAEATEGLESPWGMAQLTFFADGAKLAKPPLSMKELAAFAAAKISCNLVAVILLFPPHLAAFVLCWDIPVDQAGYSSTIGGSQCQ